MGAQAGPTFEVADAARWATGRAARWLAPVVLAGGWLIAFAVAVAGDTQPCSAADPSVCGPSVPFAWASVALFATPILLWWMPLVGCVAGIGFAVFDLAADPVPAARVAFAVHGAVCLIAAAWLLTARRRQLVRASVVARPVMIEPGVTVPDPRAARRWSARTVVALLLVLVGALAQLRYRHDSLAVERHVAGADRVDVRVQRTDTDNDVITVQLPGNGGRAEIGVYDAGTYREGSSVPVLLDTAGPREWVRLVAEPPDVTPWLTAGLGAFALAALLASRDWAARSARRRLLESSMAGIDMFGQWEIGAKVTLRPAVNARAVASVRVVPPEQAGVLPGDDPWTDERAMRYGRWWRDEDTLAEHDRHDVTESGPTPFGSPWPVTVAGSLRDGGWVILLTETGVLLPTAPLRTRQPDDDLPPPGGPDDEWAAVEDPLSTLGDKDEDGAFDRPPGSVVETGWSGQLPPLPLVLRERGRNRLVGAAMALALVGAPVVVGLGLLQDWWQVLLVLLTGANVGLRGWARVVRGLWLEREELAVNSGFLVHRVPWARLHGVRRDEQALILAWEPNVMARVGPFDSRSFGSGSFGSGSFGARSFGARPFRADPAADGSTAERAGALLLRLRSLATAAGSPDGTAFTRPGSVWAVAAYYLLVAVAAAWLCHLH
ncbi:hypothetical protein I6A60_37980 [Frankia sp. AgB1.9]|uniref:hypothetical protein n=1 Tax=unclassified Frankia TaxID=2632575 RepID=UPI00193464C1|nr:MULTISPECIES: hypothetical protein [unclassified Frankia]MBL7493365.1 hypothetical protein [Frankia sp. AgW1.1]MBL7553582.1 hypothetical protein [Frankia sp. AgB1.9]MBL7621549.1 hypothetical protein [Frankia sp. AgB1.8]